jgi:hypothetical protein
VSDLSESRNGSTAVSQTPQNTFFSKIPSAVLELLQKDGRSYFNKFPEGLRKSLKMEPDVSCKNSYVLDVTVCVCVRERLYVYIYIYVVIYRYISSSTLNASGSRMKAQEGDAVNLSMCRNVWSYNSFTSAGRDCRPTHFPSLLLIRCRLRAIRAYTSQLTHVHSLIHSSRKCPSAVATVILICK